MGHTPVQAQDTPGFIVNHAGRGFGTEALRIVGEGVADFATIDRILRDQVGFKLGPFELMDLTALDVSHPVMESIYHQYYEEPRFRPSVITAQRLAGGVLGKKVGEGFYRYENGVAQVPAEPPVPQVQDMPPVWVSPRASRRAELYQLLKDLGATIETGASPVAHCHHLVAPLGFDVTTVAVVERLDPARTIGIDMLVDDAATKRRVLATNPATRVDIRDAAHALFARDGKPVSVIRDSGGFVTQRVVATIVNIAADICQQRICSPRTWKPPSPWAWATRWGHWPWATAGVPPISWKCCSTCRPCTATRATAPAPGCAGAGAIGLSLTARRRMS
jgi:3-hydroxybutyryl-CoA dehydrogenase